MASENLPKEQALGSEGTRVGLCADCCHMRRMESARGSTFYLCQRSATDSSFPKYPRLPVLTCSGYEQESPELPK